VVKVGYIFNGPLIGQIVASVLIICECPHRKLLGFST
jgi:hypothetical protein